VPILVRAVTEHAKHDDVEAAAGSAASLATIHLERGEGAVAAGWLSRAEELLDGTPESAATGKVLWVRARIAASEGNPQQALEIAEAVYELGRRQDDVCVTALGLMYRGFFRLSLGNTSEGLADQDHAAAIALSNDIDPFTGGVLYCNVLWACRTFGDWARATQWTLSYQTFCTSGKMEFSGSCQLHRAEVLAVQGTLDEALEHIGDAISRLSADAPWALGDAHRVLGDVHRAGGNVEAARAAYETCYGLGWSPEPGHALLLLDQGDAQGALASLERSLIGKSWWTLQRQGILLAHLAVVAVHAGQHDKAQSLVEDLARNNNRWPMPSVRALTNEASALLEEARGNVSQTMNHLQLARQLWTSIEARIESARVRIMIAERLAALNDFAGASTELRAAFGAAESLNSDVYRKRCLTLQDRLAGMPHGVGRALS
jgi:tetratricopeptide (TPR) repeat protein